MKPKNYRLLTSLLIATAIGLTGCLQSEEAAPSEHEVTLTQANFNTVVSQSDKPVMIDFWAPWCGPCLKMNPVVSKIADQTAGQAVVAKVNVDNAPELASQFKVQSIPTFVFLKNGKEVHRIVGSTSQDSLLKHLK